LHCFTNATVKQAPHVYEFRPRKDKRGFHLISDALPFGGLWYLNGGERPPFYFIRQTAVSLLVCALLGLAGLRRKLTC